MRLVDAGARVTVVGADPSPAIADLGGRGLVTVTDRTVGSVNGADVAAAWLVVAATDRADVNRSLAGLAESVGKFCLSEHLDPLGSSDSSEEQVSPDSAPPVGRVTLVGGGPGDPGLLTVAGRDALRGADVVLVDRLAPLAALSEIPRHATVIDVSKIPRGRFTPQDEINRLLVEHGRAGRNVVRLKGGDNFVFGRGGEEWQACAAVGLAVEIIPGVSSALAAPALAGIPVTHRAMTQGFTVVSGHLPPGDPASTLDWPALARSGTTLILMMAVKNLPAIVAALLAAGMSPDTPAAGVADAGSARQRTVRARLADIAIASAADNISAPAVTIIGNVAGFDPTAAD